MSESHFASRRCRSAEAPYFTPHCTTRYRFSLVRQFLEGIPGLQFVELTGRDVVRHRIVADIVDAYARHEEQR